MRRSFKERLLLRFKMNKSLLFVHKALQDILRLIAKKAGVWYTKHYAEI